MSSIPLSEKCLTDTLYFDQQPVLSYHISCPLLSAGSKRSRKIQGFLDYQNLSYVQHVRNALYRLAIQQYLVCRITDSPFIPFVAQKGYLITLDAPGIVSLYENTLEYTGDLCCYQLQNGLTFDAKSGEALPLQTFFLPSCDYRKLLIVSIIYAIADQIDEGADYYYPNWPQLIADHFDEKNFYLLPDALVIFFQEDTIAETSTGICSFIIPYINIEEYLVCSKKR